MSGTENPTGQTTAPVITQSDLDKARAEGHAAGVAAESARVSGILALPSAKGNPELAQTCISTGLSLDQSTAILGAAPRAAHLIGLLGRIVGDVTVVPVGEMFADEDIQMLEAKGVRVSPAPVSSLEKVDGGVRIRTHHDERVVDGIFVAAGSMRQRSPLVAQLDLQMLRGPAQTAPTSTAPPVAAGSA